ncbi:MAG: AP2 domain-containing protein [Cyanobacteria bacterium J06649_11]
MVKVVDSTGQKFGYLTVVKRVGSDKNGVVTWECKCQCGNFKVVRGHDLRRGKTTSCGCIRKDRNGLSSSKHPDYNLYRIWYGMVDRCHNPKNCNYSRYGKKGISVCLRWRNSFDNFKRDMGERPTEFHSIDRMDNAGNYCLKNCRWATRSQQAINRGLSIRNKSGYIGTYWHKSRNRWISQIEVKGKNFELGSFDNLHEAVEARNSYILKNGLDKLGYRVQSLDYR